MQINFNRFGGNFFECTGEFEVLFDGEYTIIRAPDAPDFKFETNRCKVLWDKNKISIKPLTKIDLEKLIPKTTVAVDIV